jgi:enediyne biosynthesis protein E5
MRFPLDRLDPRYYQIAVLGSLLAYGLARLDFDITAARAGLLLGACLSVQWLCTRLAADAPRFEPRSALISGLSLCLLLRTSSTRLAILAAAIAIGSKFFLRWRGKHLFNPTNIGIVALLLVSDQVWVSPGQWGHAAWFGFLMACFGLIVVTRARRADVTFAFLICYAGLLMSRSLWLGEPLTIPLHRLQSGAVLLFAFFMISDPKTTPDSRTGRVLFAALVALGAWYVQFRLFRTNGLLWSLALWSCAVPLIDRWLPGSRYNWTAGTQNGLAQTTKETAHEAMDAGGDPADRRALAH